MKCTDCQGTGLKNENKICQTCKGFGKIGDEETSERDIIIPKVRKPRKSIVNKFKK